MTWLNKEDLKLTAIIVVVQNLDAANTMYKLCDLGIAKLWDPTAAETKQGRGTPPYMPPVRIFGL